MVGPRPHRLSSEWRTSSLTSVLYCTWAWGSMLHGESAGGVVYILYFTSISHQFSRRKTQIMLLCSELSNLSSIVLYRSLPFPWRNTSSTVYLLSCVLYLYCTLSTLIFFFFAHCFKILSLPGSFTSFLSKVCIVLGLVDGKFLCRRSVFFFYFFTLAVGRLVR